MRAGTKWFGATSLIFFLLFPIYSNANNAGLTASCHLLSEVDRLPQSIGLEASEADKLISEILSNIGLAPNFKILAARNVAGLRIANAAAVVLREDAADSQIGVQYILYNPTWMSRYVGADKWKTIALLAHEIGHHLQAHTLTCDGSNHSTEKEADTFAGHALAGMGASLEEAQSLWRGFSESGSSTHPPRAVRLASVEKGWMSFFQNRNTTSPISVQSNDHSSGRTGQYFNFNAAELDGSFGREDWGGHIRFVTTNRYPNPVKVIVWRSKNGGSKGDAHGRLEPYNESIRPWRTGDKIVFYDSFKDSAKTVNVLSTNHSRGTIGEYFNFSISQMDKVLKNQTWSNSQLTVTNFRTGKTARVVVWRGPNGGEPGDAHGRWHEGAKPGDWKVGDEIIVLTAH